VFKGNRIQPQESHPESPSSISVTRYPRFHEWNETSTPEPEPQLCLWHPE